MSAQNKFHFFTYRTALRFHIARKLEKLGWERAPSFESARFTDQNLTLCDEISKHLEYKHFLAELLRETSEKIMPLTYCINDDNYQRVLAKLIYEHYLVNNQYKKNLTNLKWILKPSTLNNGDLIKLFNNVEEIKAHYAKSSRLGGEHVIQQYIPNPDLIAGRKYTFRVMGVLTNYSGIFLYKQGYVNISDYLYDLKDNFLNKKAHITNYVLDGEFANIEQRPSQDLPHFDVIYSKMCKIVLQVMKILLKKYPTYLVFDKIKKFELFGFDFILDQNNKLWLLEINQSPDAPTFEENKLTTILWEPFWEDIIHDFVLPIALENNSRLDYKNFTQILRPCAYSRVKQLIHSVIRVICGNE